MNITRLENTPLSVYYIPNFINADEETHILKHVYSVPKPKWTCLSHRRLQEYGGVPHQKGMIPEKIPEWLQKYVDKVTVLDIFDGNKPNHVLVNEYLPGQGIMAHTDGPLFYPTVTTISCGSHTLLEFFENNVSRAKICDVLLERRSLIVLQHDMYTKYLHSINDTKEDLITENCVNLNKCDVQPHLGDVLIRDTRVSLTIRCVPKVCRLKLFK